MAQLSECVQLQCFHCSTVFDLIRFKQPHSWMEKALHHSVRGGRRRHEPRLAAWKLALEVERAIATNSPLPGASVDAEKFFDLIEWEIIFPLAEVFGLPHCILKPLRSYFETCTRFFKLGQACGPQWMATNGIFQGCSLSMTLVGLYTSLWASMLEERCPRIRTASFIDDRSLSDESSSRISHATQETLVFDQLTAGRPNKV